MTTCRYCHALIEFKEIISTGKWTAVNLSGTPHNCKLSEELTIKYSSIGEDL